MIQSLALGLGKPGLILQVFHSLLLCNPGLLLAFSGLQGPHLAHGDNNILRVNCANAVALNEMWYGKC